MHGRLSSHATWLAQVTFLRAHVAFERGLRHGGAARRQIHVSKHGPLAPRVVVRVVRRVDIAVLLVHRYPRARRPERFGIERRSYVHVDAVEHQSENKEYDGVH